MKENIVIEEGHNVHYFDEIKVIPEKRWCSNKDIVPYSQIYIGYEHRNFYYTSEVTIEGVHFIFGSWKKNSAKNPDSMLEVITGIPGQYTNGPSSPAILLNLFNIAYTKYQKETGNNLQFLVEQNIKKQQSIINKKSISLCTLSLII